MSVRRVCSRKCISLQSWLGAGSSWEKIMQSVQECIGWRDSVERRCYQSPVRNQNILDPIWSEILSLVTQAIQMMTMLQQLVC